MVAFVCGGETTWTRLEETLEIINFLERAYKNSHLPPNHKSYAEYWLIGGGKVAWLEWDAGTAQVGKEKLSRIGLICRKHAKRFEFVDFYYATWAW